MVGTMSSTSGWTTTLQTFTPSAGVSSWAISSNHLPKPVTYVLSRPSVRTRPPSSFLLLLSPFFSLNLKALKFQLFLTLWTFICLFCLLIKSGCGLLSSVFQLSSSLAKFRPHLNRNANLSFLVKEVSLEQTYLLVLFHLNTLIFLLFF